MTGYKSKKAAARDKLLDDDDTQVYQDHDDTLTIAYKSGFYDGKKAAAQEPWRESASDYERGFIDGMQKQSQSSVDKAVNRMAQPAQEPVAYLCGPDENGMFGLPTEDKACKACFPVYRQSPQRPWVGLTDKAIAEFGTWYDNREEEVGWVPPSEIVAYIDDKLRSKNI